MSDVRPSWSLSSLSSSSSSLLRPEVKTPEHDQGLCEYPNCLNAWHMSQMALIHALQCFVLFRGDMCCQVVYTWNSGSGGPGFKPRPSCCFLRRGTLRLFVSLHPGVQMGTGDLLLGGNPVMEQHPIQGEVAILLGMLHAKEIGTSSHRFGLQLMCIFALYLFTFLFPGLARAKSVPTKTYSNEVVTLWYVVTKNIM